FRERLLLGGRRHVDQRRAVHDRPDLTGRRLTKAEAPGSSGAGRFLFADQQESSAAVAPTCCGRTCLARRIQRDRSEAYAKRRARVGGLRAWERQRNVVLSVGHQLAALRHHSALAGDETGENAHENDAADSRQSIALAFLTISTVDIHTAAADFDVLEL